MDNCPSETEDYSLKSVIKSLNYKEELVYGSLAGFSICIVGHPFDTIKTYSQVFNRSFSKSVKAIHAHGGIGSFYRGIMSPLATTTVLNAGIFTCYEVSRKVISHWTGRHLTDISVIGAAGFITGTLNSFLIASIELFKIQKQIQVESQRLSYWNILRTIREKAGWSGLFKGTYLSMGRESIGYCAQFVAYQSVLNAFTRGKRERDNVGWHHLVAGGVGGLSCWVSGFPFDTLKSIYQGEPIDKRISIVPNGDAKRIAKAVYLRSGIAGFYIGLMSVMGRAVLGNATGFYVWSLARKNIRL